MGERFEKNKILFKWGIKTSGRKLLFIFCFFEFAAIVNLIQDGRWNIFIMVNMALILLYFYLLLHWMYPALRGQKNYNIKIPIKTQRKLKLRRLKKL